MVKHLKYIDGTSDKFWQISVDGNKHTVTYGRNGTSGQSKTKTFDSAEACLADAEKLYREKVKKGYSEDGSVSPPAKEAASSRPAKSAAQSKQAAIDAFDRLIRDTDIDGLIPFLESHAKGNMQTLKKEVNKAKRYWMSYVNLSKDPIYGNKSGYLWGTRGSTQQHYLIKLSALALFSLSDTISWPELTELLNQPKDPNVQKVLQWAKPTWLAEYLQQRQAKDEFIWMDYPNLRLLEEQGYMTFLPEVYAQSISDINRSSNASGKDKREVDYIATDKLSYTRDVPLLFDYETDCHTTYAHRNYQSKDSVLFWDLVFDRLLADGLMEKEFILTRALGVQTKNWNNSLKGYFRKLIGRLELGAADLLKHQHDFFPLLHAEHNAVVKFVIDTMKPYFSEDGFDMEAFLTWAEPVFMRSDVKSGVKTLLVQLDKLLKKQPQLRGQINERVADVFMVPDLSLQERAAKFLQKHASESNATIREKLTLYAPQMLGTVAADLQPLMVPVEGLTEEEVLAPLTEDHHPYVLNPAEPVRLDENRRITYLDDWNSILFQIGKVLSSENPIDGEILLHAWMSQRHLFPDDLKSQLAPYTKQFERTSESAWHMLFASILLNMCYDPDRIYEHTDADYRESMLFATFSDILVLLQLRIKSGITLPLLSLPTHEPFWVDPAELIDRLIAYEQQEVQLDVTDFAIALSRMPRENIDAAQQKLSDIQDEQTRGLMAYALGLSDTIPPAKKKSWLQALTNREAVAAERYWEALWALVARTHHPDGTFEVFNTDTLRDVPFAVAPYRPEPALEPLYYQEYNYRTKRREPVYQGDELAIDFPEPVDVPTPFLYAKDIFNRTKTGFNVYYIDTKEVTYMHSLIPQHTEAMALYLTLAFNKSTDLGGKRSGALLRQMLHDFYRFDPASNFYLATSLFNEEKEVRALAGEVLVQTIEENRLPAGDVGAKVGLLMGYQYGPASRMIEVLLSIHNISYKHNDALLQLLEALFLTAELKEKMPTNFKKLLELYFDLKNKQQRELTAGLKEAFTALKRFKALQPIINKLIKP